MTDSTTGGKSQKRLIGLFLSANFLYWVALYLYLPTLSSYALTKTSDLALVGIVLAMYGLWQALARIPVGLAVDATGSGKPFIIGGLLFAVAGALVMGFSQNVGALVAGRAFSGLAAATWVPIVVTFSRLFPPKRVVVATSFLTLSGSIGRVLATSLNGILNDLFGYGLAFYLAAGAGVASIVIFLFTPLERTESHRPSPQAFLRLLMRRDVILPTLVSMINMFATWAITMSFLPILAQNLGAGDTVKGFLISLNLVAYMLGNLLNTVIAGRLKPAPVLLASILIQCAAAGAAALSPAVFYLFICTFVMGLVNGISYPTLMGMSIQRVDAGQRTTAMGVHQSVYAVGMFTGPWLGGIIADAVGIRTMFGIVAGIVLVLSYIMIFVLWRSMGRRKAAET